MYYNVMNEKMVDVVIAHAREECPIPEAHNRQRDEWIAEEAFKRCVVVSMHGFKQLSDADLIGKELIFMRKENVGSKKWNDNRNTINSSKIEKVTDKMFFLSSGQRVNKNDLVIIGV